MKVWLGCATDYDAAAPGNQARPFGAIQKGDVTIVRGTEPPNTLSRKVRAWFPVEIGNYEGDINSFVAQYPKPSNWNSLSSQERMAFFDNARQIRMNEIAQEWAINEGIHPQEHGVSAPRIRLDVDALKARVNPADAAKIDKGFDPTHMPTSAEIPELDVADILDCCQAVHAKHRAGKINASDLVANKVEAASAGLAKAAAQRARYKGN